MSDLIEPHEADGALTLIEAHFAGGEALLDVASLRWRDESSQRGQSSRARLVLFLKRDGLIIIEVGGNLRPVGFVKDGGHEILHTSTTSSRLDDDPILRLPRY